MRLTSAFLTVLLCSAGIILATNKLVTSANLQSVEREQTGADLESKLIVHEWGTFTSFSGSDGVKLEFRPLVDNDLPSFVLDRSRQSGLMNPFRKLSLSVLQRMETPVIYFYTDREREVRVRVRFPKGLLTEFFPPVESQEPSFQWRKPEPVANSALDWGRIWLIPTDKLKTQIAVPELASRIDRSVQQSLMPNADGNNHYLYARETDSAMVYVRRMPDKKRPLVPAGDFFEKFLFYRGVGNFQLPLTLNALGDDRFELTNTGPDEIRSLFLVTVEGKRLRFSKYDRIQAAGELTLHQSTETTNVDELAEELVEALIAENLYEKEARAMVKTWRTSWFGEEGTRLFYLLPGRLTNELLPLEIQPRPDKVVRVLVGRMEIMTPEDEDHITQLVRDAAAARKRKLANRQPTATNQSEISQKILQMGRLAEPALVRVKNLAKDAVVRNEAALMLRQLQAALETEKKS